jgi:hypothetical protein
MDMDLPTAIKLAHVYAQCVRNPLTGEDPDDIAEAWNGARDEMDIRTGGSLTCRQLDIVADRVLDVWRAKR